MSVIHAISRTSKWRRKEAGRKRRLCFQIVPIQERRFLYGNLGTRNALFSTVTVWEPRFLYSSHSGVACHPSSRREAPSFPRASRYRPVTADSAPPRRLPSGQRRPHGTLESAPPVGAWQADLTGRAGGVATCCAALVGRRSRASYARFRSARGNGVVGHRPGFSGFPLPRRREQECHRRPEEDNSREPPHEAEPLFRW